MLNKIPTIEARNAASSLRPSAAGLGAQALNLKSSQALKDEKGVDKAAGDFEALLLQQMMESMWSGVEFSNMLNENGNEAQMYRDMFSQAVAETSAKGRGIGVKDFLKKELLRNYAASNPQAKEVTAEE